MNLQLRNWGNFCRYYSGDLYGTWTRYYLEEKFRESFQCIRSFRANDDCSEISHQNHYIYADGTSLSKTFSPYLKPTKPISPNQTQSYACPVPRSNP
ncbi:DUF3598 family protein [Tolypothrix sp. VBCCA 56010]|uniref:DUF3598 family protein n=1 Tax=Tolypothrix sp. VBCCA 56010 TaxID=3137731 RepID=UPI003D7DE4AC